MRRRWSIAQGKLGLAFLDGLDRWLRQRAGVAEPLFGKERLHLSRPERSACAGRCGTCGSILSKKPEGFHFCDDSLAGLEAIHTLILGEPDRSGELVSAGR